MAILKPCPRCGVLIPRGWGYCPACKPIAEAERGAARERRAEYLRKKYNQDYNRRRAQDDPKYRTFRNSKAWRETSRAKLQGEGWECEAKVSPNCTGLACEVHHIKPLRTPEGWDRRLDWSNLMSVCVQCHNVLDGKTYRGDRRTDVIDMRTLDLKHAVGDKSPETIHRQNFEAPYPAENRETESARSPGGGQNSTAPSEDNGHRRRFL